MSIVYISTERFYLQDTLVRNAPIYFYLCTASLSPSAIECTASQLTNERAVGNLIQVVIGHLLHGSGLYLNTDDHAMTSDC